MRRNFGVANFGSFRRAPSMNLRRMVSRRRSGISLVPVSLPEHIGHWSRNDNVEVEEEGGMASVCENIQVGEHRSTALLSLVPIQAYMALCLAALFFHVAYIAETS